MNMSVPALCQASLTLPLAVPRVAPTGLILRPLNSTAIELSWQPLDAAMVRGVLTQYTVVYRQEDGIEKAVNVPAGPGEYVEDCETKRELAL